MTECSATFRRVSRTAVAIIMRSMNEQPHTEVALRRLGQQSFTDYTLYNVDSGSTDGTWEVVERYNPVAERRFRIAPTDYVPGKVLNDMVARTTEPILVLQNADAIPMDEHWLERLVRPLLDGTADATMSRQIARPSAHFVVNYDMDRGYSSKAIVAEPAEQFSAVACAFCRSLWEQTPFYTDGYSEDLAWARQCRERGGRFLYVPASVVEHSHNYTIEGLYKKRYRHGVARAHIYGQGPALGQQLLRLGKELARDLLQATRKGRLDTVPYNVVYRSTIHLGLYRGQRDATVRKSR